MNIEEFIFMKSFRSLAVIPLILLLGSCGFFRNYAKDNTWSYFEEWDVNKDSHIDKDEFFTGVIKDGLVEKTSERTTAETMFTAADETKDGKLTSLEFYRWRVRM